MPGVASTKWGAVAAVVLVLVLVASLVSVVGPNPGAYEGRAFAFFRADRPGNMNGVADYEYRATWHMETHNSGPFFDVQNKDVWVRVDDQRGDLLLNDKLLLRCGGVVGRAQWPRAESLQVTLYEGSDNTDGAYNVVPESAQAVLVLTYRLDPATHWFKRIGLKELRPGVIRRGWLDLMFGGVDSWGTRPT